MAVDLSVGLASLPAGVTLSQEAIYREADEALYQAKSRKGQYINEANIVRRVLANPLSTQTVA
jgi:GGDEF domain-containing protein